jgi:hypothetical protein
MADPRNPEPTPKTQLTQPKEGEPIEIPVPKEDDFDVRRVAKGNDRAGCLRTDCSWAKELGLLPGELLVGEQPCVLQLS